MKIMPTKMMMCNFIRSNRKIIHHFYNLKLVKACREVLMKILLTYNITKKKNRTTFKIILTIINHL
jgi:hypothetical protein